MTRSLDDRLRCALLLAAILALTTVVYWPGLSGGFIFDDFPNIVDNKALAVSSLAPHELLHAATSSPASELRRPLASLSFAFDIHRAGLDPRSMKNTNLLIHLFNVALVFLLAFQLWRLQFTRSNDASSQRSAMWFAGVCAAAWGLAPINLTPVLYVVQRMESLCNLFVLAGLYAYITGRRRQLNGDSGWWLILSGLVLGTGFGLLAKESAVLLPLYAVVLEWMLLRCAAARPQDRTRLRILAAAIVVTGVIGAFVLVWRAHAPWAWTPRPFTLLQRALSEPRILWDYVHWTLFPSLAHLGFYYDDYPFSTGFLQPPSTALAAFGVAFAIIGAIFVRKTMPLAALGVLWFFAGQSLTAAPIPLELVFEHRNYFPSFGLLLAVAAIGAWLAARFQQRTAIAAIAIAWIGFFAMTTSLRALEWSNPVRLVESLAAKQPGSPRTQYELGRTYLLLSNYDPHSPFTLASQRVLEHAARMPGASPLAEQALLFQSARLGWPAKPEWWDGLMRKLALHRPDAQAVNALYSLSHCVVQHACRFPPQRIIAAYQVALGYPSPPLPLMGAYADYASNVLDDQALAVRLMRDAVARAPTDPSFRKNLVYLLYRSGDSDAAMSEYAVLRKLIGERDASIWAKTMIPALHTGMP